MTRTKKHWLEKTGWWKHLQALGERSLDEFLGAIKRREEQSREEGFVSGYNYGLSHKEGMRCCIHCSNKTSLREEIAAKLNKIIEKGAPSEQDNPIKYGAHIWSEVHKLTRELLD